MKLALDRIDRSDERFRVSHFYDLDKMVKSIRKIGLIYPPILAKKNGRYIIVTGWKRISACKELSFKEIPVFILREMQDLSLFLIAFYENWTSRAFSVMEKAEILFKLGALGMKEEDVIRHFLPLLKLPPTRQILDEYRSISTLSQEIKVFVEKEEMPYSSLKQLVNFSSEEQKMMLPLILNLGQNKQKEIMENLREISSRDSVSVKRILEADEIQKIFLSEQLSSIQKTEKFRLYLKKRRYPEFTEWQDSFRKAVRKIQGKENISIEPYPFWEDNEISVKFSFRSRDELIKKLSLLNDQESWARLFKFLQIKKVKMK